MSSPFQRSPSGDPFGGVPVGSATAGASVVPVFNASTGDYEPRTLPAGGGGTVPALSTVFYVDAGTTTPLADQDGSIGAPYADLQDALDARATDTFINTFLLTPQATPYGAVSLPNGVAASLIGLGGEGNTDPVVIGAVTLGTDSFLSIENVRTGDVTGPGAFRAFGTFSCGDVSVASVVAEGTGLSDPSSLMNSVTATQSIVLTGVLMNAGAIVATDDVTLVHSSPVNVTAGNIFTADLYSLARLRENAGIITSTSSVCSDAPTIVISGGTGPTGFEVPAFVAPGVQEITVGVPGARPGDTFAYAVSGGLGIYPANVGFGPMRCINNDEVVLEAICPTTSPDNTSCDLTVTRFSVGSL
jgi:hypothetical protein